MSGFPVFQFTNSASARVLLVVEPCSNEYWVEAGATVQLQVDESKAQCVLDFEYLPGGMVVYAPDNRRIDVYQNGLRLAKGKRSRTMAKKLAN